MAFDVYAEELARQISSNTDDGVAYVIPMDLRAAHEARHYSLDFLYQGEVPYSYVVVDEKSIAQSLSDASREKTTLKIVRWVQDKHHEADAKEMVNFLLASSGAKLKKAEMFPVYTIETYALPSKSTQFQLPNIETPIDVTLDERFQIRRAFVSPQLTADGNVAVAVTFASIAMIDVDYKASLRLFAPDGSVAVQKDRILLHNWHQATSQWPREEVNEYYLLPFPADSQPGDYSVKIVVYHPETLEPLTENGQVEIEIGTIEVIAP